MTKSILKTIVAGILLGAALYFVPMLVVAIAFFSFLTHFLFRRRMMCGTGYGGYGGHRFALADKVRSMTEEEYSQFKSAHSHSCCSREKTKN
jgi:hypothetical protein